MVAEVWIEHTTSRLWALRATTALLRDMVILDIYSILEWNSRLWASWCSLDYTPRNVNGMMTPIASEIALLRDMVCTNMVPMSGLEPPTSGLWIPCSHQLSYIGRRWTGLIIAKNRNCQEYFWEFSENQEFLRKEMNIFSRGEKEYFVYSRVFMYLYLCELLDKTDLPW